MRPISPCGASRASVALPPFDPPPLSSPVRRGPLDLIIGMFPDQLRVRVERQQRDSEARRKRSAPSAAIAAKGTPMVALSDAPSRGVISFILPRELPHPSPTERRGTTEMRARRCGGDREWRVYL